MSSDWLKRGERTIFRTSTAISSGKENYGKKDCKTTTESFFAFYFLEEDLSIKCLFVIERMFRKFDEKESVSSVSQLKSSVQKNIRNQVNNIF